MQTKYNMDINERAAKFKTPVLDEFVNIFKDSLIPCITFANILGKTGSGKDTITESFLQCYACKWENKKPEKLKMRTTRPKRSNEEDSHNFCDEVPTIKYINNFALDLRGYNVTGGEIWYYWFDINDLMDIIEKNKRKESHLIILMAGATIETVLQLTAFVHRLKTEEEYLTCIPDMDIKSIYIKRDDGARYLSLIKRELQREKPDFEEMLRRIEQDNIDYPEDIINFITYYEIYNEENSILPAVSSLANAF